MDVVEEQNDELVFTVGAHATPSGLVTVEAYETITGLILEGIEAQSDADGILLSLHGAMVAEGIDDGEGTLLGQIRSVVGYEVPIVVTLDLHSHITEEMVDAADVLIGYQKYPHTDTYERGVEATRLITKIASGQVRPVSALNKPLIIPPCGTCHTQGGLYKELWDEALRPDRPAEILTSSLFAGFPYADIPPMGFAVLVYADANEAAAQAEANLLADMAWDEELSFCIRQQRYPMLSQRPWQQRENL